MRQSSDSVPEAQCFLSSAAAHRQRDAPPVPRLICPQVFRPDEATGSLRKMRLD